MIVLTPRAQVVLGQAIDDHAERGGNVPAASSYINLRLAALKFPYY
jgi:hypothetical protein